MARPRFARRVCGAPSLVRSYLWRRADYCALDFETTGLDLAVDDIISYGAVTVSGGRVRGASAVYALACPRRRPSPAAVAVHTLRAVDCADAPGERETAAALEQVLTGKVLVAHAAWIETSFLTRYLALCGARPTALVVDTAALARAAGVAPVEADAEPGLEWLSHRLGLPPYIPHHALGDAMTTAVVFAALVGRLEARGPRLTVGELVDLSQAHALA